MKNGQLPTWFVIKWLSQEGHEKHFAEGKEHRQLVDVLSVEGKDIIADLRSTSAGLDVMFMEYRPVPLRSDWTLYDAEGKRVKGRKSKARRAAEMFAAQHRILGPSKVLKRVKVDGQWYEVRKVEK